MAKDIERVVLEGSVKDLGCEKSAYLRDDRDEYIDNGAHLMVERANTFWKVREMPLESVVAAAVDHGKLARYFREHWDHEIREGSLADNVIRLLREIQQEGK